MQVSAITYDARMERFSRAGLLILFAATAITYILLILPVPGGNTGPSSGSGLPAVFTLPFVYSFNSPGILNEADVMQDSSSPYWWLNSGGELIIQDNAGNTMQGDAPLLNRWRIAYALSNPVDTDGGLHPQNLFRLVSKGKWENVTLQTQFYIAKDNLSSSPNRNQSNGLLLMSRYTGDGQTLYYAGVRVDGTAVIKKKYRGTYYTLAQRAVFPGTYSISAASSTSQNLLPHDVWIGLRATTTTNGDGSVTVILSMQTSGGAWTELLRATDSGSSSVGKTPPITGAQYAGIRTDFMDVRLGGFRAQ